MKSRPNHRVRCRSCQKMTVHGPRSRERTPGTDPASVAAPLAPASLRAAKRACESLSPRRRPGSPPKTSPAKASTSPPGSSRGHASSGAPPRVWSSAPARCTATRPPAARRSASPPRSGPRARRPARSAPGEGAGAPGAHLARAPGPARAPAGAPRGAPATSAPSTHAATPHMPPPPRRGLTPPPRDSWAPHQDFT